MSAGASVRLVEKDDDFLRLREPWAELLSDADDANTFLSFEWLSSWWRGYRFPAELKILVAEKDGRIIGIAPMMLRKAARWGLAFRALHFLGDLTFETDHMNFVLRRGHRAEALAALLPALERLPWDAAHFNQIPEGSPTGGELLAWAGARGFAADTVRSPCPMRALPASYDALLASMQSRFRTTLRSSRRKLSEKYKVEFGLHSDPDEFPAALDALYANHASRWKAKGQSGVFRDGRKRDFYALLVRELHARGWLRFFYLKLDGAIKAQEFCFAYDGVVYLLQEGFDYAHAEENIGNTLRGMVFERLIADGCKAYDFLAGMSRNKKLWGDAFPDDLRIEVARSTWKGRLYFRVPKLIEALKERVKRALGRAEPAAEPASETASRGAAKPE